MARYLLQPCIDSFVKQNRLDQSRAFYRDKPLTLALLILSLVLSVLALTCYINFGYHGYFSYINALAYDWPAWVSQLLTVCGDTGVALMIVFVLAKGDQQLIWFAIVAAIITAISTHLLKNSFATLRPAAVLLDGAFHLTGEKIKHDSFPSGHSATIFTCMSILAYKYKQSAQRLVICIVAMLVALSRVWVGAHWPIDIMTGGAIGALSVVIASRVAPLFFPLGMNTRLQALFLLLFVADSVIMIFYDTGYEKVSVWVSVLAILTLVYTLYHYLILPLLGKS